MRAISALRLHSLLGLPLLLAAACTVEAPLGSDIPQSYRVVVDTPAQLRDKLDLLLVIDDSSEMAARQQDLGVSFRRSIEQLSFGRGLPDLQVTVMSSDMGAGPYADSIDSCSATGNAGRLTPPTGVRCGLPEGDFLRMASDVDGSTLQNFEGELADTIACLTELGESGCDYEQHLESMKRGLDGSDPLSTEFIRNDAVLGVLVLSDEDDCSTYDPELFNPDNPQFRGDDPTFRCFQSGVICDGDDVYSPGQRQDCRPRTLSNYSRSVDDYVDFMRDLKPDPRDLVVAGLMGDPSQVGVDADAEGNDAQLLPSCEDQDGNTAYPAVRLGAFVDAFGQSDQGGALCNDSPTGTLDLVVRDIRQSLGTTCLEGPVSDIDPDLPGRQVSCFVYEQVEEERDTRRYFPECDRPGNLDQSSVLPCYSILTGGEACGDFPTQLALQVHGRKELPLADARLIAQCLIDE